MNGNRLRVTEMFGVGPNIHEYALPEQFLQPHETPEQRLYLALIELGLNDLASKGPSTQSEAREWFASRSEQPGSFAHACYVLNMDADVVREWVLR